MTRVYDCYWKWNSDKPCFAVIYAREKALWDAISVLKESKIDSIKAIEKLIEENQK
jgi:hypothetical protein